ncbi:MAG: phosphotransferase [Patescibacteria group bacterium]|jgi:aminoglycoside phosphotransferase (APT) family kinase protein
MNKVLPLFEEDFVLTLFRQDVLPLYPAFSDISRVDIRPYKKLIWETTYHVVIGFDVYFTDPSGRETKIPIVCSAHSDEPRRNVFDVLNYLWEKKIPDQGIDLPRPLFFSQHFNGTFYRALSGENLLHYIKRRDQANVERIVIAAAGLLAKLHALPVDPEADFNPDNARIATVIPGVPMIIKEIRTRYQDKYYRDLEKIYAYFISQEDKLRARRPVWSLIHGDAHPENIIATGEDRIGLIDFTDFCLADPIRDVAAFAQQLEYKIINKLDDLDWAKQMRDLFVEEYLAASRLVRDKDFEERFRLYYDWTAIRTSTFWFLKFGHNEERAAALLSKVKADLGF